MSEINNKKEKIPKRIIQGLRYLAVRTRAKSCVLSPISPAKTNKNELIIASKLPHYLLSELTGNAWGSLTRMRDYHWEKKEATNLVASF